jgi:hypothetical protein
MGKESEIQDDEAEDILDDMQTLPCLAQNENRILIKVGGKTL